MVSFIVIIVGYIIYVIITQIGKQTGRAAVTEYASYSINDDIHDDRCR